VRVAKRKKAKSKSSAVGGALGRGLSSLWRFIAKSLGSSVRFIARGARDLDPAHQRDGIAFLILILALIATAGTWFNSDNVVGRAVYSVIYGGVGRVGFLAPLILIYFAFRLFRVPEDSKATGRIIIGTLALLLSTTGLAHLLNGSVGTGATAMRQGGGWLGYGVSTPLVTLMTSVLTYPVLLILFIFGVLVITATPVSEVFTRISTASTWLWSKRPERTEKVVEEFEITDTPPFESPVVAAWNAHTDEDEEELDEDSFDDEFPVEDSIPAVTHANESTVAVKRPEQLLLTADVKYELPGPDLLRTGPAAKAKSKANDLVVAA
jgi:S-DNA-T family DNA segregation ATPase FtsK/SpoIIIE